MVARSGLPGDAGSSMNWLHAASPPTGDRKGPPNPTSATLAPTGVKDSPVMLSPFVALRVNSAKHLSADRDRPFAALRVTLFGNVA